MHHAPADVDFALYIDVFEGLFAEFVLAQGFAAAGDWAVGWS